MTTGNAIAKIIANLTDDTVNGPTLWSILTKALESPLVAAHMQMRINAIVGEIHFWHFFLIEKI